MNFLVGVPFCTTDLLVSESGSDVATDCESKAAYYLSKSRHINSSSLIWAYVTRHEHCFGGVISSNQSDILVGLICYFGHGLAEIIERKARAGFVFLVGDGSFLLGSDAGEKLSESSRKN